MSLPGEDQHYLLLGIGVVDASLAVQKATSQGNLYYTSQDRFTGLCGSINIIKKDSIHKINKDNFKKTMSGFMLFMIPILIKMD